VINHIILRRPREVWGVESGADKLVVRPEKRVTAKIESSPEKMYWADLSNKAGTKVLLKIAV
jgi:hypothetical protein